MCRKRVLAWVVLGLVLLASGAVGTEASDPSPPPGKRAQERFLPILLVPPRSGPAVPAVWDSLAAIELRNRWSVTDSLATLLIARLEGESDPDSLAYAHALLYLANSVIKRRIATDPRGFATLERAIGIRERHGGEQDSLALWAHAMAATFYSEAGQAERALHHADQVIANLDPEDPATRPLLAQAHLGRATSLAALRRPLEARPEFEEAIRLRELVSGPEGFLLVPMLAEYGVFLVRVGEFDPARDHLRRAVAIAEADVRSGGSGSDFLDGCLSRLSTLENRTGNVAESLDLAQRAHDLVCRRAGASSISAVRMRTIISYRLLDLGDFRGAADLLRGIVPAMESGLGPGHSQTINARLALLEALIEIGDTEGAERELAGVRSVLATEDPLANSNWTYCLQLVADLEAARGHTAAARETLTVAIDIERRKADPSGENLGQLLIHLLDTMNGMKDRATVESIGAEVGTLADSTSIRATPIWAPLLIARAGAEARVGLPEAAWDHALTAEELGRTRFTYEVAALPDARALRLAGHLGKPCELLVDLVQPGDDPAARTAWDRLVRWRGRVRHEIAHRRLPTDGSGRPELVEAHSRWTAAQRRLAQLVVSGAATPEDPGTADRFEEARLEAENLERQYMRTTSGSTVRGGETDLDAVLARVGPRQAIVAFAIGDDGSGTQSLGAFLFRGDRAAVEWIRLGGMVEIGPVLNDWMRTLSLGPEDSGPDGLEERTARELGHRVRALIWDPLDQRLDGIEDIVLVPEGPVTGLPWLALPEGEDRYLAESGRTLRILEAERDLLEDGSVDASGGLLAVGGPDFDRSGRPPSASPQTGLEPSRAWRCTGAESLALPPLPAARGEVEDIAGHWPGGSATLLVGDAAGEAAFKRAASGRAVIHLATHGVVVDDSCGVRVEGLRGIGGLEPIPPVETGPPAVPEPPVVRPWLDRQVWLALAGANLPLNEGQDENEGLLTAQEVITLDLRGTEWVVLSACHSAGSSTWTREGALGMQRAFRLAGARAVIASHWSVGDASTREWMDALYAARRSGGGAGSAVGAACRTVLAERRRSGRSTHPFYWAAFTATGD